jgi:hypothetical protein
MHRQAVVADRCDGLAAAGSGEQIKTLALIKAKLATNRLIVSLMLFFMPLEIPFGRFVFANKQTSNRVALFRLLFLVWFTIKLLLVLLWNDCHYGRVRALFYDWTIYYPTGSRLYLIRAYVGLCAFHIGAKASSFVLIKRSWNTSLIDHLTSWPPSPTLAAADMAGAVLDDSGQHGGCRCARKTNSSGAAADFYHSRLLGLIRPQKTTSLRGGGQLEASSTWPAPQVTDASEPTDAVASIRHRPAAAGTPDPDRPGLRDYQHWLTMSSKLKRALKSGLWLVLPACMFIVVGANLRLGYFLKRERSCDIELPLLRLVGLIELNFLFTETMMIFIGTFAYIILVKDDLMTQANKVEESLDRLAASLGLQWHFIQRLRSLDDDDGRRRVAATQAGPAVALDGGRSRSPSVLPSSSPRSASTPDSSSSLRALKSPCWSFSTSSTSSSESSECTATSTLRRRTTVHPSSGTPQARAAARERIAADRQLDTCYLSLPQTIIYPRASVTPRSQLTRNYLRSYRHMCSFVPDLRLVDELQPARSRQRQRRSKLFANNYSGNFGAIGEPLPIVGRRLERRLPTTTTSPCVDQLAQNIRFVQHQLIVFLKCIDNHQQPVSFIGSVILVCLVMGLSLVPVLAHNLHMSTRRSLVIYVVSAVTPVLVCFIFTGIGAQVYRRANRIAAKVFGLCMLYEDCCIKRRWNKIIFIWYVPNRCALKIGDAVGLTYLNILKSISFIISGLTLILTYV